MGSFNDNAVTPQGKRPWVAPVLTRVSVGAEAQGAGEVNATEGGHVLITGAFMTTGAGTVSYTSSQTATMVDGASS